MRRALILTVATLVGGLSSSPAQRPGDRIRLKTDSDPSAWLTGVLVGQGADSVRVELAGHASVTVARGAIRQLEVSRGQRRGTGTGAIQGAGWGSLVGAVIAARGMAKPCGLHTAAAVVCGEERMLVGSGLGAAVGALVGASIGSLFKTERWEAGSVASPQVVVTPQGAGLALSVAL